MKIETITQFETNLDHLSGEEIGAALNVLNSMPETLDAIYLYGIGKKNRPAGELHVLCMPEKEEIIINAIFRHTHTLGIRKLRIERVVQPREQIVLSKDGDQLMVKTYEIEGKKYFRPEADSLQDIAMRKNIGVPALKYDK